MLSTWSIIYWMACDFKWHAASTVPHSDWNNNDWLSTFWHANGYIYLCLYSICAALGTHAFYLITFDCEQNKNEQKKSKTCTSSCIPWCWTSLYSFVSRCFFCSLYISSRSVCFTALFCKFIYKVLVNFYTCSYLSICLCPVNR